MSDLVTDYQEGTLPLRTWVSARMHLMCCTACTNHYRQMRETIRLIRIGAPRSPAESVEDAVLARLARSREGGVGNSNGHVNDP